MNTDQDASDRRNLLPLALLSLVAGAAAGLCGALFRVCLDKANELRGALVNSPQFSGPAGLIAAVVICATATALAAWLVRRFAPRASGSGIPHTEEVLEGE